MTGQAAPPVSAGALSCSARPGRALLGSLPRHLGASAERLLIGVSVYREPADYNAVLFQVGSHDWTAARAPDRQGPAPPYQAPADLSQTIAACEAAGLFIIAPGSASAAAPADGHTVFVEPWMASELHRLLAGEGRGAELTYAHQHAAEYWQWRSAAWPQGRRSDMHDLLEARHHLFDASDTEQASTLTEAVCAQLHAWGDLGRESALIHETLDRLPARSSRRAAWIYQLGRIAEVRGDHADAELRYQQALEMFVTVGDRPGISRSYHSLGVLAQARGEYAMAERHYLQSSDAAALTAVSGPARAVSSPATADPATAPPPAAAPPATALSPSPAMAFSPAPTALSPAAAYRQVSARPRVTAGQHRPSGTGRRPPMVPVTLPGPAAGSASAAQAAPASGTPLERQHRRASGWRLPCLAAVALTLAVISAVQIAAVFSRTGPGARPPSGTAVSSPTAGSAEAVRRETATWVERQVARSAIVACDPAMCSVLQAAGTPAGNLIALGPGGSSDPLGSSVVIATAAVRSLLGARLARIYAPVTVATFGTGGASVQVRVVAPDGSAAYLSALKSDQLARRRAGAQLLPNKRISAAPLARRQLGDGQVDSRLLTTLAALAVMHPLRIVSFAGPGPGASGGVPLPVVVLTEAGRSTSAAYLRAMLAFLRAQRAPFLAATERTERLSDGQEALRVEFAVPGPLGLLTGEDAALPVPAR